MIVLLGFDLNSSIAKAKREQRRAEKLAAEAAQPELPISEEVRNTLRNNEI
jgi:hypothetical protein